MKDTKCDDRLPIVKVLPWLQRVDTVVVTDELRTEARHADEREALDSGATDCTLFSLSGRADGKLGPTSCSPLCLLATYARLTNHSCRSDVERRHSRNLGACQACQTQETGTA
jgi:hypothetical protein